MGIFLAIEYALLFLLSSWMTATAINLFRGASTADEDMQNLHGQVFGAIRAGDLPRAILILEGEPGPLAAILSSVLSEATKFTPKLRVAYKVTLDSLKRRSLVETNPFRIVSFLCPFFGLVGFIAALIARNPAFTAASIWCLVLALLISAISWFFNVASAKRNTELLTAAGELGRETLNFLLGPESPLPAIRGRSFPPAE